MCYTGGPYCSDPAAKMRETAKENFKKDPSADNKKALVNAAVAYDGTGAGQKELKAQIEAESDESVRQKLITRKERAKTVRKDDVAKAKKRELYNKYGNNSHAPQIDALVKSHEGAVVTEGPYGDSPSDRSRTVEFPYRDGVVRMNFQDRAFGRNEDGSPSWERSYSPAEGYYVVKSDNPVSADAEKPLTATGASVEDMQNKEYWDKQIDSCTGCNKPMSYSSLKPTYGASRVCSDCYDSSMSQGEKTYR